MNTPATFTAPQNYCERGLQYCKRHIVALHFVDQQIIRNEAGEMTRKVVAQICSGFVISIRGEWFWITAGHVIEDINKALANKPEQNLEGWRLIDFRRPDSQDPGIPFDYPTAPKRYYYAKNYEGYGVLDIGYIYLDPYYRRLLSDTVPLSEVAWTDIAGHPYCLFEMIGFPAEKVAVDVQSNGQWITVNSRPKASLIPLEPPLPEFERHFVAHINDKLADATIPPPKDINGMSGSPVFGCYFDGNDLAYRLLAVECQWLEQKRLVTGFPVGYFTGAIEALIDGTTPPTP